MSGRSAVASNFVPYVNCKTPAHRMRLCVGVFVCLAILPACENGPLARDKKDRTLELTGDTIDVPAGVDLHDVAIHTDAQSHDFEPKQLQAAPGDYVRFTTADSHTHAIVFEGVSPEIKTFLENSGQLRSPPLVTKGASWVIALKNAPAGVYRFRCLMHNDAGEVTVAAR
jgi:plastocyanin